MGKRSLYQRLRASGRARSILFAIGVLLMIVAVIIGPLPGPGFTILFPVGLMICLQNSAWAKRRSVRFKQRHPRYGDWADRIMRRVSAARRRARNRLERVLDDD